MRTFKWDPCFDPEEETTTAVAWISLPALPPNFFCEAVVFSLAAAVGKPLQVDLATKNKTRPSFARVKVEVGPKYCTTCMIQGHDIDQCYVEHPELFKKQEQVNSGEEQQEEKKEENISREDNDTKEGDKQKDAFVEPKREKGGRTTKIHVWNRLQTSNKFNSLTKGGEEEHVADNEAGNEVKDKRQIHKEGDKHISTRETSTGSKN